MGMAATFFNPQASSVNRQSSIVLLLALVFSGVARAESGTEIFEPVENSKPKKEPDSQPPLNVDEPGFKAKVVFPEKPAPKFDLDAHPAEGKKPRIKEWTLPREEGVEDGPSENEVPEPDALASTTREEISPALANVMEKEKNGKKLKELLRLYLEVVENEPENAPAHYRFGVLLARNGEWVKGAEELDKARSLKPENPKYQRDFGLAALQLGWLERGLEACQKAAAAMFAGASYQSALGDCYLALRRYDEADDAYSRAISLDKGRNADYIYNLGVASLHARAFKRALEIFDEAIKARNDCPRYYCGRGLACEYTRNVKQAIADYSTAIKLDRNCAYAHYLLAGVYSDPDDPTYTNRFEAKDHAEIAVKLTAYKNAPYLMGLARALRVYNDYDQAIAIARKAVELNPCDDYKRELSKLEQERFKTR